MVRLVLLLIATSSCAKISSREANEFLARRARSSNWYFGLEEWYGIGMGNNMER